MMMEGDGRHNGNWTVMDGLSGEGRRNGDLTTMDDEE